MKSLTICYITARKEPMLEWFFDSLSPQIDKMDVSVVVVWLNKRGGVLPGMDASVTYTEPKPSVWAGPHRLTKSDWWTISNSRNTGICLCKSDWISFLDDRCVLMPGYLKCIREAMDGDYAVAGGYEKRFGLQVKNGKIIHGGEVTGVDARNPKGHLRKPVKTYGGCWCGCNMAIPLDWCLEMNGFDETCDSLGLEDVVCGNMLMANGHVTKFDPRMMMIEDRDYSGNGEKMPLRTDKGISPNDRSHGLLAKIGASKRAIHPLDIRAERERVLRGEPWTIPTEPKVDWWDGEPLEQMYVR